MEPDYDTLQSTCLLLGPLVCGLLQQLLTEPPARSWHTKLNKSPYRPPPMVFPLVWVWSYLSLGYASHLVRGTIGGLPLQLVGLIYVVHLMLINSWGFFIFSFRRIDYALNVMLLVDVSAMLLVATVSMLVPFAAALCVPYFCWLLEMTYLNIFMFRNNAGSHLVGLSKEEVFQAYRDGRHGQVQDSQFQ